jgi:hypothetical protein
MSRVNLKEERPQRVPRVRVQWAAHWGVGGSAVLQWSEGKLGDIERKEWEGNEVMTSLAVR